MTLQHVHVCFNSTPNAEPGAVQPGQCNDCQAVLSVWNEDAQLVALLRKKTGQPIPTVCGMCMVARFRLLPAHQQIAMVGSQKLIQQVLMLVNQAGGRIEKL